MQAEGIQEPVRLLVLKMIEGLQLYVMIFLFN